jgi:hypothetical protein
MRSEILVCCAYIRLLCPGKVSRDEMAGMDFTNTLSTILSQEGVYGEVHFLANFVELRNKLIYLRTVIWPDTNASELTYCGRVEDGALLSTNNFFKVCTPLCCFKRGCM